MPYAKMDSKKTQCSQRTRFKELSLKKNKVKLDEEPKKLDRSSNILILDESFDILQSEYRASRKPKTIYSPIVIDDSTDLAGDDLPEVMISGKEPSRSGNVSFNGSKDFKSPTYNARPSIDGWSPAQNIICATPQNNPIPTTDTANESYEKCSNKIQVSQKKVLNDLYGETWKSIPHLFKTLSKKYDNFDGVSKKLQFDEEKENIRHDLKRNKELYLTGSDLKRSETKFGDSEKKSKKKLFTDKVPSTPDIKDKVRSRNVNSTTKKSKIKPMSVTELVEAIYEGSDCKVDKDVKKLKIDTKSETKRYPTSDLKSGKDNRESKVDALTKKIEKVHVTPNNKAVNRLSFMGSLADNIPTWRCHIEALQYRDNYKTLKEQLTRRLYKEFNREIFDDALDADLPVLWDGKLRSTAGTTTNRLMKNSKGDRIRTSSIKLSSKVLDAPQRLRDTLVHELCHAATWLVDAELRAGHGPLWKKWAAKALEVFPELGEISRCHDLKIHFKYSYKCSSCGYSIQRHSKSIDITKKCCGYCRGTFEIVINKKTKDGVVVSTPARKGTLNEFAKFVKDNYAFYKDGKTHAQVMKLLGEKFAIRKNDKIVGSVDSC